MDFPGLATSSRPGMQSGEPPFDRDSPKLQRTPLVETGDLFSGMSRRLPSRLLRSNAHENTIVACLPNRKSPRPKHRPAPRNRQSDINGHHRNRKTSLRTRDGLSPIYRAYRQRARNAAVVMMLKRPEPSKPFAASHEDGIRAKRSDRQTLYPRKACAPRRRHSKRGAADGRQARFARRAMIPLAWNEDRRLGVIGRPSFGGVARDKTVRFICCRRSGSKCFSWTLGHRRGCSRRSRRSEYVWSCGHDQPASECYRDGDHDAEDRRDEQKNCGEPEVAGAEAVAGSRSPR